MQINAMGGAYLTLGVSIINRSEFVLFHIDPYEIAEDPTQKLLCSFIKLPTNYY